VPAPNSLSVAEIHAAIERLGCAIRAQHPAPASLILLGIANGGIELAARLAGALGSKSGTLDISFHRDDINRHPIPKEYSPTRIPVDVTSATVILVDDVLFSGRTVKAALDELFDHGRPAKVELAVLIDRTGRKLPIAADYIGLALEVPSTAKIAVQLDAAKPARDSVRILADKPTA
jgi:pyrimidine operon attenuation protein/uracil phosphoribosyltransferase